LLAPSEHSLRYSRAAGMHPEEIGGKGGNRTLDPGIMSAVL
jgi:hypothetical protein